MISHEELLNKPAFVNSDPLSLCIAPIGLKVDWARKLPDEVLYIPEELFEPLASDFLKKLTVEEYYDKKIIDGYLQKILLTSVSANAKEADEIEASKAINNFFIKANKLQSTHYIFYEGP